MRRRGVPTLYTDETGIKLISVRVVVTVRRLPDRRVEDTPTRLRVATAWQAERGGYSVYFCARSRKIARISSRDLAVARLSRMERSFKNFAIDARVRR
jgi:hypothetical protein